MPFYLVCLLSLFYVHLCFSCIWWIGLPQQQNHKWACLWKPHWLIPCVFFCFDQWCLKVCSNFLNHYYSDNITDTKRFLCDCDFLCMNRINPKWLLLIFTAGQCTHIKLAFIYLLLSGEFSWELKNALQITLNASSCMYCTVCQKSRLFGGVMQCRVNQYTFGYLFPLDHPVQVTGQLRLKLWSM